MYTSTRHSDAPGDNSTSETDLSREVRKLSLDDGNSQDEGGAASFLDPFLPLVCYSFLLTDSADYGQRLAYFLQNLIKDLCALADQPGSGQEQQLGRCRSNNCSQREPEGHRLDIFERTLPFASLVDQLRASRVDEH